MSMHVTGIHLKEGPVHSPSSSPMRPESVRPFLDILGAEEKSHQVRRGDTLWHICRKRLEAGGQRVTPSAIVNAVRTVARTNRIENPDLIYPGQQLDLSGIGSSTTYAFNRLPLMRSIPDESLATLQPEPSRSSRPLPSLSSQIETPPKPAPAYGRSESLERLLESLQEVTPVRPRPVERAQSPWARLIGDGPRRLTGEFGMRADPFTGQQQRHDGIDIAAPTGAPIYPLQAGRVTFSGWHGNYGRLVIVEHADGTETRYAHASKLLVRDGQRVAPWMPIAHVGSSGRATGPHLHFEVHEHGRPVDPIPYLTSTPVHYAVSR